MSDPIAGREWVTDSKMAEHQGLVVDREYACIFKLTAPRHCDDAATKADPTLQDSCDCQPPSGGTGAFTHQQVPAVCNDADPTIQDYAKTYPTIRELELAKLMGSQGIISSLCPIHTSEQGAGDPLYGLLLTFGLAYIFEDGTRLVWGAQSVPFQAPAWPERTYTGIVARISHTLDKSTRTMAVELTVTNRDG